MKQTGGQLKNDGIAKLLLCQLFLQLASHVIVNVEKSLSPL